jgi:ribonucleoside-diphosphate reductase beta chain
MTARIEAAQTAELKQLGDVPVSDVLAILDGEVAGYRELYYRWERQQWEAGSIDFSDDRRQWDEMSPELQRSLLWMLSSFYVGKEQITQALVPFVDSAPSEEQQVYLTTQLVDEARHTVFFDRFYADVISERATDMKARLDLQVDRLNEGSRRLLLDVLPAASARIRGDLTDLSALVEGVALCHIVTEAVAGLTLQRYILDLVAEAGMLPGFRCGFTAVARDETRHVGFGVRFLKEMVELDDRYASDVRAAITDVASIRRSLVDPPHGDPTYFDPLPFTAEDLTAAAQGSMRRTLASIGIG